MISQCFHVVRMLNLFSILLSAAIWGLFNCLVNNEISELGLVAVILRGEFIIFSADGAPLDEFSNKLVHVKEREILIKLVYDCYTIKNSNH